MRVAWLVGGFLLLLVHCDGEDSAGNGDGAPRAGRGGTAGSSRAERRVTVRVARGAPSKAGWGAYRRARAASAAEANLRALSSLTAIDGFLYIFGNPALPTCEAQWLRASIGDANIGGPITIENNDGLGSCN